MKKAIVGLITMVALASSLALPVMARSTIGTGQEDYSPEVNNPKDSSAGNPKDSSAGNPKDSSPKGGSFAQQATEGLKQVGGNDQTSFGDIVSKVINFLLFFVGVISVIMIIYGGVRYTTSAGDSGKVTNAKNTILYAIVGLIVSILAYAIVNFVVKTF